MPPAKKKPSNEPRRGGDEAEIGHGLPAPDGPVRGGGAAAEVCKKLGVEYDRSAILLQWTVGGGQCCGQRGPHRADRCFAQQQRDPNGAGAVVAALEPA